MTLFARVLSALSPAIIVCLLSSALHADPDVPSTAGLAPSPIDTAFLEKPWKDQLEREFEVGRHNVYWRQRSSKSDGLFAGMRFTAPLDRKRAWYLANEYSDVGLSTPGIKSVQITEKTPTFKVVRVEAEVLWISLALNFEVEQLAPEIVRFRLVDSKIGQYFGYCRFQDAPAEAAAAPGATQMEFATWFKSSKPIPGGLALLAERMVLLRGARSFLRLCEKDAAQAPATVGSL